MLQLFNYSINKYFKQIFVFLAMICLSQIANAQLRVLSNGNVGIGTNTPITGLDVRQGSGRITANGLFFWGSGLAPDGLPFPRLIESWGMRYASPDNRWAFSTSNSFVSGYVPNGQDWGSGNVFASGKIGIGTTNINLPQSLIIPNGDIFARGHLFLHAFQGENSNGTAYIQARNNSTSGNIGLIFRTSFGNNGGRDAVFINSNGDINLNVHNDYFPAPSNQA